MKQLFLDLMETFGWFGLWLIEMVINRQPETLGHYLERNGFWYVGYGTWERYRE